MPWPVPRLWEGETAFILGGGPSLADVDAEALRGRHVVAIKEAGLTLAPWAEALVWCDPMWIEWNVARLALHKGALKICRHSPHARTRNCPPELSREVGRVLAELHVKHVAQERGKALSLDPTRVAGVCAGAAALNIAVHLGARPIGLLGFDMRPGTWHGERRRHTPAERYAQVFAPALKRMARSIEARGIEVVNLTPGSALDCFPRGDLAGFLAAA